MPIVQNIFNWAVHSLQDGGTWAWVSACGVGKWIYDAGMNSWMFIKG